MRGQGFGFIAPLLVLMVVAFIAPIAYMLGLAFWEKGRGFTLEHYEGLAETPVYLRVLGNTMRIALIATLANILIGYPLAHWMRGLGSRARIVAVALVVLPFWVSNGSCGSLNTMPISIAILQTPSPCCAENR